MKIKKMMGTIAAIVIMTLFSGCVSMPAASAEESVMDSGYTAFEVTEPSAETVFNATQRDVEPAKELAEGNYTNTQVNSNECENYSVKMDAQEENAEENAKETTNMVSDATMLRFMREIAPEMGYTVRIVEHENLTTEDLAEREGSYVLIDRMECVVEDSEGNGRILNVSEEDSAYNYIKFDPQEFETGDLVEVYCTYADTAYADDVESRADFLVGTVEECAGIGGKK